MISKASPHRAPEEKKPDRAGKYRSTWLSVKKEFFENIKDAWKITVSFMLLRLIVQDPFPLWYCLLPFAVMGLCFIGFILGTITMIVFSLLIDWRKG